MDVSSGQPVTLINKKFYGIIQNPLGVGEYQDERKRGRYLVHIPELMHHISGDQGIWCTNGVHSWRITNSGAGEYGQYFPLHHDTHVIVEFYNNDTQSGVITRIISDYIDGSNVEAQDCTTTVEDISDRDEQYVLFKTPKKWNIFYVNEDTQNEPNTIYLVYNRDDTGRRTTFRIDEDGLHFWTRDNNRVRIKLDDNKQVDGNQTEYVKGYRTKHIDGDEDLNIGGDTREKMDGKFDGTVAGDVNVHHQANESRHTTGNITIHIEGQTDISVDGDCNVWSDSNVNVDAGGAINLNSGGASKKTTNSPTAPKPKTTVRDGGMGETSEYDYEDADVQDRPVVVGKKADASQNNTNKTTDNYNVDHRETLPGVVYPHHKPE